MSLLDDVSIVVTPNGYKAGRLYGVLPVPTEGSELLTNGDFSSGITGWDAQTGWDVTTGSATCDGTNAAYLFQSSGSLPIGKLVIVTVNITSYTSGTLRLGATGVGIDANSVSGIGTHTVIFTTISSGTSDVELFSQNFIGSIDNVSIKEYTASDMSVTRATAATRVDENGLVNYAEIIGNEEVSCGTFDCANPDGVWNKTQATISGGEARIITTDGSYAAIDQSNVFVNVGKTYLYSIDVKSISGTMQLRGGSGTDIDITTSGVKTGYIVPTSTGIEIKRKSGAGALDVTIDNVSVKEVTRDNVPRIDYTGGGCPHILAEPQRTNLLTYSEDFSTYTPVGGIVVEGNQTDPNGNNTAYKLSNFSANNSRLDGNTSSTAVNGVTYTYSAYYKGSGTIRINCGTSTGVGGSSEKDIILTNEWTRQQVTFTASSPTGVVKTHAAITRTPNNDAIVYLAFAQIEEGSYPTSYIPTSGSTVTRNQDIFTRDGIGSLINSTEGTLFLELAANNVATFKNISINSDSSNRINFFIYTSSVTVNFDVGGVTQASLSYSIPDVTSFNKFAFTYKLNEFKLFVNGTQRATDTSGIVPSANTFDTVSFNDSFGNNFFGKVKQLQVYDTSLTDNQLIQLTGTAGTDFYESYSEMAESLTYTIQ